MWATIGSIRRFMEDCILEMGSRTLIYRFSCMEIDYILDIYPINNNKIFLINFLQIL
jgi:hypothetical protein